MIKKRGKNTLTENTHGGVVTKLGPQLSIADGSRVHHRVDLFVLDAILG